jgi:UDP:flavonoid glycosyltransferase YjiC (YdhE family)
MHPTPTLQSRAYAYPIGPLAWHMAPKPGLVNELTHWVWNAVLQRAGRAWTRGLREQRLGLPRESSFIARVPRLVVASTSVFSRPRDWPPQWHMTGYAKPTALFAGPSHTPEVEQFLATGAPPVVVAFSSSPVGDTFWKDVLVPALRLTGRRAIVVAGWSHVPEGLRTDDILVAPNADYATLFPRAACIMHAAGIGTLCEALRAGVPAVVVPGFGEQKLLAAHAWRLGLVPRPLLLRDATPEMLADRIVTAIESPEIRERTHAMSLAIRMERGDENACDIIEALLPEHTLLAPLAAPSVSRG